MNKLGDPREARYTIDPFGHIVGLATWAILSLRSTRQDGVAEDSLPRPMKNPRADETRSSALSYALYGALTSGNPFLTADF